MESTLSILAIIISAFTFLFSFYTFRWTARRDRKQATLDAYNTLQNEAFDKLNPLIPSEIQEIMKHTTSKEYNEVSGYIARIERCCVGVNQEIYDRKTVYELAHGYFDGKKLRSRMEPVIDQKNQGADKDYYENIHKVLAWMDRESGAST